MTRKPLIAGNWKMNLNHFEAIALVQKIAFALPDKYYDKVDVTVLPPFTNLRSVQTLVDGDKLRLTYGARTFRSTSPAPTPVTSAVRSWRSWAAASSSWGTPSGGPTTTRTTSWWPPRPPRRSRTS